jgi:acylphosphatase
VTEPGDRDSGRGDARRVDARLSAVVSGRVQGVGFRYWVRQRAEALGLAGAATNLADGRVLVEAEGLRSAGERLLADLSSPQAPGAVADVTASWLEPVGEPAGFRVR